MILWRLFSERPPFIEIKQQLSEHYRNLLNENQNEEKWKMPKSQQDVKFVNSATEHNSVVYNEYYPGGMDSDDGNVACNDIYANDSGQD